MVGMSYRPFEKWQIALRYEETDDMYGFAPRSSVGGALSWEVFQGSCLSLEYITGRYDDYEDALADRFDLFTIQWAVGFENFRF